MLQDLWVNPWLSAHAYLFGEFDFNSTLLATFRTKIISYNKPDQQDSWGEQVIEGWYVGPTMDHYQCVECFYPQQGLHEIQILFSFTLNMSILLQSIQHIFFIKNPSISFHSSPNQCHHQLQFFKRGYNMQCFTTSSRGLKTLNRATTVYWSSSSNYTPTKASKGGITIIDNCRIHYSNLYTNNKGGTNINRIDTTSNSGTISKGGVEITIITTTSTCSTSTNTTQYQFLSSGINILTITESF